MTYIAVALFAAAVGAWIDRWWADYLADTADTRSMKKHDRVRRCQVNRSINPRRWD